jgi:hypothetical protein
MERESFGPNVVGFFMYEGASAISSPNMGLDGNKLYK